MSILLGHPTDDSSKVSPALAARGIDMIRAAPVDIFHAGIPSKIQFGYKAYTGVLPAFMYATHAKEKQDVSKAFYPCMWPKDRLIPLPYPPVCVEWTGTDRSAEFMDKMKTLKYQEETYQGKKIKIFQNVTKSKLDDIFSVMNNPNCPAPDGAVNYSCLASIMVVKKIFSNFFVTHHYPAFMNMDHEEDMALKEVHFEDMGTGKRKRTRTDEGEARRPPSALSTAPAEGPSEMEGVEEHSPDSPPVQNAKVRVAYPQPNDTKGWGGRTEIPNSDGRFLPFLPELAEHDGKMVSYVVTRYFLGCLGTNAETCKTGLERIRAAFGIIKKTRVGAALAHMAFAIDIGLQAQARIFPIFDGDEYVGSLISGAGYHLLIGREKFAPAPYAEIQHVISQFGSHRMAFEVICDIASLRQVVQAAEVDWDEWVRSLTMVGLSYVLRKQALSDTDRDRILREGANLKFSAPSFSITASNISLALREASHPGELPEDWPLHFSMLFEKDKIARTWSGFGLVAPSCKFKGQATVNLKKSANKGHFAWKMESLAQAIADLKEVRATHQVTVPPNNKKSGPHKDRIFEGESNKELWAAVRVFATGDLGGDVTSKKVETAEDEGMFDEV